VEGWSERIQKQVREVGAEMYRNRAELTIHVFIGRSEYGCLDVK